VSPEEIKAIYLKFIDNGLHKGKLHIYDKYKRCVLSNEKQSDIEMKTYSNQDYKRIEGIINTRNQIDTKYGSNESIGAMGAMGAMDTTNDMMRESNRESQYEIKLINELIAKCPKLEIMTFFNDYLVKIKESINQIFDIRQSVHSNESHSKFMQGKQISHNKFDINRHLGNLNSQIAEEINTLVKKLTITDKNINKYTNIMLDMGDYKKQYKEYKETMQNAEEMKQGDLGNKYSDKSELLHSSKTISDSNDSNPASNSNSDHEEYVGSSRRMKSRDSGRDSGNDEDDEQSINYKSNLYRYNKKEEHLQYSIKFLNDVINQIKNNNLSNPLNRDSIRIQFRDFLRFGENINLFKILGATTAQIYSYSRLFKSKHKYRILYPEMVSSILHYLNIISLVNLFDELDDNKLNNKSEIGKIKTEIIDYNFNLERGLTNDLDNDALRDLRELNRDMNFGLEQENQFENQNLIQSFEIKNNKNIKVIEEFIVKYLDKINNTQTLYDDLTPTKINLLVSTNDQKTRDYNLRGFRFLSESDNEAERQLVYMQMHKFEKLDYGDVAKYLTKQYGDKFTNFGKPINSEDELYENEDIEENDDDDNYNEQIQDNNRNDEDKAYSDDKNDEYNEYRNMDNALSDLSNIFDGEVGERDQDYGNMACGDGDD